MFAKFTAPFFALLALPCHLLFGEDAGDTLEFSRPTLSMSQEATQVRRGGEYIKVGGNLNDIWMLPSSGAIDFQAEKNRRLGLEVMLAATYFASPVQYAAPQNYVRNISVTLPRLDASYVFGDLSRPFLKADIGIFNYKYDEYARNLGEYMFRTWAYPGIVETGGNFGYVGTSSVTLTGLKLSQSLGMFSHELLATLETEMTPLYDLNLTYMARFNYHDVFKIGGGIQLARALSANAIPEMRIHYFAENGAWYPYDNGAGGIVGYDYYSSLEQGIRDKLNSPSLSPADSARLDGVCQCSSQGSKSGPLSPADSTKLVDEFAKAALGDAVIDSVHNGQLNPQMHTLTAQAIKPVLYFSFDPKSLIRSNLLGPKDLVLYGEAAVLGVKSYPVYYTDIWRRIPIMLGFNAPTFKLLDVLSIEVEYYGSRWLPTYISPAVPAYNAIPVPFFNASPYYPSDWDKDNWKWSVYAERSLTSGITLSGQVASDHARTWDWVTFGKTPWEMYTSPSQWYWALKLGVKI